MLVELRVRDLGVIDDLQLVVGGMNAVRKELDQRLSALGVATKADLAKLEAKIDKLAKSSTGAAKAATKKAPAAKKATA